MRRYWARARALQADALSPDVDSSHVAQATYAKQGYRDLRPLNEDGSRMRGVDAAGSEVVIVCSPDNGQVLQVVYVHPNDE